MTTIEKNPLASLRRWHRSEDHPVWFKAFSEEEQKELVEDDLSAGYSVALVLVAIVTIGFLLVGSAVLVTVF